MRSSNSLERDPKYYFEDGDCQIRVETTLFRIHKFPLTLNSSTFSDMFIVGNSSRNNSIIELPDDDTSEEFRALCWALYNAPPDVTQALAVKETLPNRDISRLLSLVLISHKYSFDSHETWAKGVLRAHCLKKFPDTCSAHDLNRLVRYYTLVEDAQILDVIHKAILKSLDAEKPELGPWLRKRNIIKPAKDIARPLNPVQMLCLGETYGWRELQGSIYYRLLCDAVPMSSYELASNAKSTRRSTLSASALLSSFPESLNVQQKSNMMQGFVSITAVWDSIVRVGFGNFFEDCSCFFARCKGTESTVWGKMIADASKSFSGVDILERLAHMRSSLDGDRRKCITKLATYLEQVEEEIESSLADYFLGDDREIRKTIYSEDHASSRA